MDAVIPIRNDLSRVRVDAIQVADLPADGFAFSNPRSFAGGRAGIDGQGFDNLSMTELRASIIEQGLQHPLLVRIIGEGDNEEIQLIAGERRLRCVWKIRDENTECFNRESQELGPGADVHEYVECRIYPDLSDLDAMKFAWQENATAIGIGEAANYNWFCYMRKNGATDEEMLAITHKTESWIRSMDRVATLDEHCRNLFLTGQINQTVAGLLADIGDDDERIAICDATCEYAHDRVKAEIAKRESALRDAREDKALADADLIVAEHREKSSEAEEVSPGATKAAAKAVEVAGKKVAQKKRARDQSVKSKKGTTRDLVAGSKVVTGQRPKKAVTTLRAPKIEKCFIEPSLAAIEEEDDKVGDVRDLKLIVLLCTAIVEGDTSLKKVMDTFYEEVGEVNEDDDEGEREEYDDEYDARRDSE